MANDKLLYDLINTFNKHIANSNQISYALYQRIQRQEADKTPGETRFYTVLVEHDTNDLPFQILRREGKRQTSNVYNQGPDDCLIGNIQFDPTSILQRLSDPANPDTVLPSPNQVISIGLLPSGAAAEIRGISPLWCYNLASSGSLISIFENLYGVPGGDRPGMLGMDGLAHQGYTDGSGRKSLV